MGDRPIEAPVRQVMNDIAKLIDGAINQGGPRQYGFFLGVFRFGEEGRFNYISNADRKDIVVLLKEMTARFEGQPEMQGRA